MYDTLLIEYRAVERKANDEISEMNLELRMKRDEVERITHLYEDNLILVKELKGENEIVKQKLDLVKSEYYELESKSRTTNSDVIAELAVSKERLKHYEAIEKELDDAIV